MKWIKLYEEFTNDSMQDMLTDALEKDIKAAIKKNGHFSAEDYYTLTKSRKLEQFIFRFEKIQRQGEETYYWGTLYCPDYTYGGEEDEQETLPGKLYGRFVAFEDGPIMLDFEGPNDLTAYDFCEGIEHELDNFAEYAVDEINKKINNNG